MVFERARWRTFKIDVTCACDRRVCDSVAVQLQYEVLRLVSKSQQDQAGLVNMPLIRIEVSDFKS
jgi:hypothetical protein